MTRHEAAQLLKLMDALTSLHSNVLPPLQQLSSIWPGLCNLLGSLLQASNQHKVQEYQQQATQAQADANWQQGSARQAEGQNIQTQQPGSRTAQLNEATRLAQQGESLLRLVMGQVEAAHIVAEVAKRCVDCKGLHDCCKPSFANSYQLLLCAGALLGWRVNSTNTHTWWCNHSSCIPQEKQQQQDHIHTRSTYIRRCLSMA
jgi:hypothetical protein